MRNEAETRADLIDPQLIAAGWGTVEGSRIRLGLTATPNRDANVDTYAYFGEPVYIYSLKEGINDGFLTPFRVKKIPLEISAHFKTKQQIFLDFVLSHYVKVGVGELDQEKLTPLLRLKYHNSIADAINDLGPAQEIRKAFSEFQRFLDQDDSVA